ncbi:uncharacterized protein ACA1_370160 [Acanthamoeba castellanii str. Neff]|uniref:Uncharacterized protein n=1 Tax=Acanthamoeba castellanii (strain ATCC 30010 / Neff) TaxID=1257118 RepID=L8GZ85_ACACF|nr:uncharacterized protein ACA1_370160 [Acanthamoeba castellanii str. Neff]ELR18262.1 hypothetical protein ACA1_370160 [Acanthamoeba castellanii str. Neff]
MSAAVPAPQLWAVVTHRNPGFLQRHTVDCFLLILAIFIPPAAVFLKRGCDVHLLLNFLLWIFTIIFGIIHAWWVVLTTKGTV